MSGHDGTRWSRRELVARIASARKRHIPDHVVLSRLLELELLGAAVYELALRSAALAPPSQALAGRLHAEELAHARALARLDSVVSPAPLRTEAQIDRALARAGIKVRKVTVRRTERDWLTLLEDLESTLQGGYWQALGTLSASFAELAATILGSEAQHLTLLFSLHNPLDVDLTVAAGVVQGTPPPAAAPAQANS